MSILVTGGAGFIGSHLLERLLAETDERLVCLDNFNAFYDPRRKRRNVEPLLRQPRFRLVEADLCDTAALDHLFRSAEIHVVFHLAAQAGVRYSFDDPLSYERANVAGTLTLLEAVRHHPVERFLFASSSTIYGRGCPAPFREDGPLGEPASHYGVTKRAAEMLVMLYHRLYGIPAVVLRPFSVYGPRLRPDLAMTVFARAILRGDPLPLFGDGSVERDFTYVDDIVDGVLAAWRAPAERPPPPPSPTRGDEDGEGTKCGGGLPGGVVGQAINLGHHQPVPMLRLIELLAKELDKPPRIQCKPAHPGDLPLTNADLTKARRLLGYHPKVPLEEGVRRFVAWFKDEAMT